MCICEVATNSSSNKYIHNFSVSFEKSPYFLKLNSGCIGVHRLPSSCNVVVQLYFKEKKSEMLPKAFSCFTLSCAGTGNRAKSMYTLLGGKLSATHRRQKRKFSPPVQLLVFVIILNHKYAKIASHSACAGVTGAPQTPDFFGLLLS